MFLFIGGYLLGALISGVVIIWVLRDVIIETIKLK